VLHDVAAKNNVTIKSSTSQEAYLAVLQAADVTAQAVQDLPDYIDPRLVPVATINGAASASQSGAAQARQYRTPDPSSNSHNAWRLITELRATNPTSQLLKGKTIAIKDNMSVGGIPYTCGMFTDTMASAVNGEYPISSIDSSVAKRVLEAGGTITGITTCENYSLTPLSYTSANGAVHNPYLRNFNTGGSTSGGACALSLRAARERGVPGLENAGPDVDMQIGGDQAGSIRMPSSFTGVYGLKPTHGLVPYTGCAGLHPMIDHAGPMAQNVDDVALLLTALAGYDGLDGRQGAECPLRENVPQYHEELAKFAEGKDTSQVGRGMKVGIITESLSIPGTVPEVARVVEDAAMKYFAAAGAQVERVSVPMHLLGPAIWTAASRNHMASLTAQGKVPDILTHNLPHFVPKWPLDQEMFELLSRYNPAVINIIFSQTFLTEKYGPEVQGKAHRHVFQLRAAYDKALEDYDVLITPTGVSVAPPHPDLRKEEEGGSSVMDKMKLAVGSTNNTCPFNATGHPGFSVPCGWGMSEGGKGWLPVGMQIIGKRWKDLDVLKAAKVFEYGGGGLGKWPGSV
jgi:amidase